MRLQHRAESEAEPKVGATVAGWRLVRPLPHEIPGVVSFVAVAERPALAATASTHWQGFATEQPTPLVQRHLSIATDEAAAALLSRDARVRHRHGGDFVRPHDELLSDGHRRLTVGELVHETPYATLVTQGAPLVPGAIVTLLVPVLESIAQAHRGGFTHGRLTLNACRLDDRGKPWLGEWYASVDLADLSGMRRDLALQDDLRGLGRVCDALLARCPSGTVSGGVRELVDALAGGTPVTEPIPRLVDALFAWATPTAVVFTRSPVDVPVSPTAAQGTTSVGKRHFEARAVAADAGVANEPALGVADELLLSDEPLLTDAPERRASRLVRSIGYGARLVALQLSGIRPRVWLALAGAGSAVALVAPFL